MNAGEITSGKFDVYYNADDPDDNSLFPLFNECCFQPLIPKSNIRYYQNQSEYSWWVYRYVNQAVKISTLIIMPYLEGFVKFRIY